MTQENQNLEKEEFFKYSKYVLFIFSFIMIINLVFYYLHKEKEKENIYLNKIYMEIQNNKIPDNVELKYVNNSKEIENLIYILKNKKSIDYQFSNDVYNDLNKYYKNIYNNKENIVINDDYIMNNKLYREMIIMNNIFILIENKEYAKSRTYINMLKNTKNISKFVSNLLLYTEEKMKLVEGKEIE